MLTNNVINFEQPGPGMIIDIMICDRFGYVVFDTIDVMEEQLKEKQGAELEGQQIFLDYTNDKSSHIAMAKKGLRGFSK